MDVEYTRMLFATGKFSDFSIDCQGLVFPVHKAIVCVQSPVIDKALTDGLETMGSNIVKIEAFDTQGVYRMLCFMYGFENPLYAEFPTDRNTATEADAVQNDTENLLIDLGEDDTARGRTYEVKMDGVKSEATDASMSLVPYSLDDNPLIPHVWTNAVAHYFGVTKLAELAVDELKRLLGPKHWSARQFGGAANMAACVMGDLGIQHLFATLAVRNAGDLLENGVSIDALFRLQDFGRSYMMASTARVTELKKVVADAKVEVATAKASERAASAANVASTARIAELEETVASAQPKCTCKNKEAKTMQQLKENVRKCHAFLKETDWCRHCYIEFTCYFEEKANSYTLRCRNCQTRQ